MGDKRKTNTVLNTNFKPSVQPAAEKNMAIKDKSLALHLCWPPVLEIFLEVKIRAGAGGREILLEKEMVLGEQRKGPDRCHWDTPLGITPAV